MSLNREQSEKFRDRHLREKYELLHMLPNVGAPALSGLYLKSFFNGSKRYQLTLPSSIIEDNNKFCGNCGVIRISTFNLSMKIDQTKDKEDNSIIKRKLIYHCHACNSKNEFNLGQQRIKEQTPNKEEVGRASSAPPAPKIEKSKKSAKQRAKARKMNSLSNMLLKKNEEKKNKSTTSLSSLSLENFMKN